MGGVGRGWRGHSSRDGAGLDQASGWELDKAVNSGETSRVGTDQTLWLDAGGRGGGEGGQQERMCLGDGGLKMALSGD